MQVQIDFWQLLLALAGLISAFAMVVWAFGAALIRQFEKRLGERFAAIEEKRREAGALLQQELATLKKMEQDFIKFQIEAPDRFVLRNDYIRGQSILEAKQDALFNKMEVVRLEIAQVRGGNK
jgi:hypothetical protein